MNHNFKSPGFSLFEILLVLSIVSMVMVFVLPWGSGLIDKNRAFNYVNLVREAVAFARASSIVNGQKIFFCHDAEGAVCRVIKNKCPAIVTESGQILRFLPPLTKGDKFCPQVGNQHLVFMPHGISNGRNGSLFYCPRGRSEHARSIIFNQSGRVRIDTVDAQGRKIRCDC